MKDMEWILPQTQVLSNDLSCVTSVLKHSLPTDFRGWLLSHNGAAPEPLELSLADGSLLVINSFVSFSQNDSYNVIDILRLLRERLPSGLIPIADDHGGNYVCLRYSTTTSSPEIVQWLHEEAGPKRAIVPIASLAIFCLLPISVWGASHLSRIVLSFLFPSLCYYCGLRVL